MSEDILRCLSVPNRLQSTNRSARLEQLQRMAIQRIWQIRDLCHDLSDTLVTHWRPWPPVRIDLDLDAKPLQLEDLIGDERLGSLRKHAQHVSDHRRLH